MAHKQQKWATFNASKLQLPDILLIQFQFPSPSQLVEQVKRFTRR